MAAVFLPLATLVTQEEVEDVLAQRFCDQFGTLHRVQRLIEVARQFFVPHGATLRRGQCPYVFLGLGRQGVALLDSAKTGGVEIEQMRGLWAELQNRALERAGEVERVDHRSLEAQREAALERGDELTAEELDRDPELKLGPAANSMERRAKAMAERQGREYKPVTERGAVVHAARQARAAFREMRARLELARETYSIERESGQGRVSAGLAALRAATAKDRDRDPEDFRERLASVIGRSRDQDDTPKQEGRNYARERLKEIMEKDAGRDGQAAVHKLDSHSEYGLGEDTGREARKPSVNERLKDVLNKPREKLEIKDEREQERGDDENENTRDRDRGEGHSL